MTLLEKELSVKRSFVFVSLLALLCTMVATFASSAPAFAARSRCNASNAGDFDNQVREYGKHVPAAKERAQRFTDLDQIVSDIAMEESALEASCTKESDRQPIDAQLHATAAWALVQEADMTLAQLGETCPAARDAGAARLLAAAWYELAKGVPEGQAAGPKSIAQIVPMVQSRAAAVKLTLPAVTETSTYWRDQVGEQAKTAMAACPK